MQVYKFCEAHPVLEYLDVGFRSSPNASSYAVLFKLLKLKFISYWCSDISKGDAYIDISPFKSLLIGFIFLQNLVNQVFTDANGATTGNQELAVNSAALVQVTTGAIAGTYLVINDSTDGFQSSNDLLINITGFTGTLPALGNIPEGNFFV